MAERINGILGTGTALGSSINRLMLFLLLRGGGMSFFPLPKENSQRLTAHPNSIFHVQGMHFLFSQLLHLRRCHEGLVLPPNLTFPSPLFASQ